MRSISQLNAEGMVPRFVGRIGGEAICLDGASYSWFDRRGKNSTCGSTGMRCVAIPGNWGSRVGMALSVAHRTDRFIGAASNPWTGAPPAAHIDGSGRRGASVGSARTSGRRPAGGISQEGRADGGGAPVEADGPLPLAVRAGDVTARSRSSRDGSARSRAGRLASGAAPVRWRAPSGPVSRPWHLLRRPHLGGAVR
jgi:hypothetical protein